MNWSDSTDLLSLLSSFIQVFFSFSFSKFSFLNLSHQNNFVSLLSFIATYYMDILDIKRQLVWLHTKEDSLSCSCENTVLDFNCFNISSRISWCKHKKLSWYILLQTTFNSSHCKDKDVKTKPRFREGKEVVM